MKICIVGSGAFGKALLHILHKHGDDVSVAKQGEPIVNAEVVVLCVPAESIRDVLPLITFSSKTRIIVNTAKGIETKAHKFPYQIVNEVFGDSIEYYSLVGPSFASEVVKDMPTLVNIGYQAGSTHRHLVQELFQTDTFRVRLTKGVEVLEIASAMKNIYAIGCGIASGLGYGENTKAKIQVLAIEEMHDYFRTVKLRLGTKATAGTIGDLILTCASSESRNYRFGQYLVSMSAEKALKKVNSTVEGYTSLRSLSKIKQDDAKLPLASFIAREVQANSKDIHCQFDNYLKKA